MDKIKPEFGAGPARMPPAAQERIECRTAATARVRTAFAR
jgi:hypothetical protein